LHAGARREFEDASIVAVQYVRRAIISNVNVHGIVELVQTRAAALLALRTTETAFIRSRRSHAFDIDNAMVACVRHVQSSIAIQCDAARRVELSCAATLPIASRDHLAACRAGRHLHHTMVAAIRYEDVTVSINSHARRTVELVKCRTRAVAAGYHRSIRCNDARDVFRAATEAARIHDITRTTIPTPRPMIAKVSPTRTAARGTASNAASVCGASRAERLLCRADSGRVVLHNAIVACISDKKISTLVKGEAGRTIELIRIRSFPTDSSYDFAVARALLMF
jgi:hypothetical protein